MFWDNANEGKHVLWKLNADDEFVEFDQIFVPAIRRDLDHLTPLVQSETPHYAFPNMVSTMMPMKPPKRPFDHSTDLVPNFF